MYDGSVLEQLDDLWDDFVDAYVKGNEDEASAVHNVIRKTEKDAAFSTDRAHLRAHHMLLAHLPGHIDVGILSDRDLRGLHGVMRRWVYSKGGFRFHYGREVLRQHEDQSVSQLLEELLDMVQKLDEEDKQPDACEVHDLFLRIRAACSLAPAGAW